jgi:hypothetical protein
MNNQPSVYNRVPDKTEIIGFIVGGIPFFCHLTSTSTHTVNGRVVESSYTDFVAIALGVVAVLIAFGSYRLLEYTADDDRMKRIGVMVAIAVLGVYQVLRGIGTFA